MDLLRIRKQLGTIPGNNPLRVVNNNQLTAFLAFKQIVNQLAEIEPLARLAQQVQASPLYQQNTDQFVADVNGINQIRQNADPLFAAATALRQIVNDIVPQVPGETIVVTFPSKKELAEITSLLDDLEAALSPLVYEPGINGKLEVIHWQSGSLVVFIFLGTMTAVGIIARALKAAAIAYQEIQKGRATAQQVEILKEHVRDSKIKNDLAAVIAEAQKDHINAIIDREAKAVELDIFNNSENERLQRIKYSVKELAELFEKGAKIAPALDMPQEARDNFPDVDHLLTVAPPIKQLQAGAETADTEQTPPGANPPE